MRGENELNSSNGGLPSKSTLIQYANAVPSRPGYNQCEFCNIIAHVDTFFSSSKRFCSCVCSRSFSSSMRDHGNSSKNNERRRTLFNMNMKRRAELQEIEKEKNNALNRPFEWGDYLDMVNAVAAPVGSFPHCSKSDVFQRPLDSRKVEIVNPTVNELVPVYWIATIIRAAGYLIKVRMEGYEDDCSKDCWLHLFNDEIHPLTWCALNKRELVIPLGLQMKSIDWINYLKPRLSESFSLSDDFEEARDREKKFIGPFVPGIKVEVINKHNLSCMKVATVEHNRGGRLVLKYDDSKMEDKFFWCHSMSDIIHHIGWSCMVGHDIDESQEYKEETLKKIQEKQFGESDATPQMFEKLAEMRRNRFDHSLHGKRFDSSKMMKSPPSSPSSPQARFVSGMKLEVVDPSNPAFICAATVVKTLKNGYIMVKKDSVISSEQQNLQRDLFCFHSRSPYILPAGFCLANDLKLVPPIGYNGEFDWKEYSEATGSLMAPISLFAASQVKPQHRFEVRMKVEAANLLNPKQICVGTIMKIVGRLMRVKVESLEAVSEQWMDVYSPDVYPVGWCQAFGHPLEAPRAKMNPLMHNRIIKKQKKMVLNKGSRKRKKMKLPDQGDEDSSDDEFISNNHGDNSECEKGESGKDFLSESSPTYSPYGCGFDMKALEKGKLSDDSDADVVSKVSPTHRSSESERKNIFSQLSDDKFESAVPASLFDEGPTSRNASEHDDMTFTMLKSGLKADHSLVR